MAQAPNMSLAQNPNTTKIVDSINRTITVLDPKTDQPVMVCKFTVIESPKNTTNNTLSKNIRNVTTCENLTPVKPTINETLTTNTENATSNVNLTDKFNTLQGK